MTTDSRKIQLETAVDATGAKAGFQQIKDAGKDMATSVAQSGQQASKGLDGVGDGAKRAADTFTREEGRLRAAVQRATLDLKTLGKTASEKFEAKIELQGIDSSKLAPYIAQLKAAEQQALATAAAASKVGKGDPFANVSTSLGATSYVKPLGTPTTSLGATSFGAAANLANEAGKAATAATVSLTKMGVSAGQTQQALRQLPAQFTDIVTSLQGGQKPLTVLIQQGGQIKDSFGGVVPALKAVGGAVLGLINPFTVAAAAVGSLGIAYYQGAQESTEYNKALILTGNYLGLTTSALQEMAKEISSNVGTQGAAAEALTALANSGKVASSSLTEVGTAVVLMNRVLGTAVDEATATFSKLADEPTKASAKLNESMHYLNLATYERIRALEEQGSKEEAAALAQSTFATETVSRLRKVEESTGTLQKGWRSLMDTAKGAWDAMLGIGRAKTSGEALEDAQKRLAFVQQNGGNQDSIRSEIASLNRSALNQQEKAIDEGEKARQASAQISASDRLKKLSDEIQTNADKRKKALKDLDNDFKTLGKATSGPEYDKLVANINDKYKDPKGATPKAYQDDAGTKMLEQLKQQEASLKAQLDTDDKLTDSEKERAKFVQLVADLKNKGTLTADQKSLVASQQALLAQLDINVAVAKQVEAKKEAAKLAEEELRRSKEFAKQIEGVNISIASSNQSRNDQQERALGAFGLGDRAREEVDAQRTIRREYESYKRQLTKDATDKNQLGSDAYKEEVAKINSALDDALKSQQDYFDALKAKREDWKNGATTALANYIDEINDASKRAQELVGSTLNGVTDGITDAIFGDGKSSALDIGKKLAKQIVRGFVEQDITKPIAEALQGSLKDPDSIVGKLLGGLTGNKGESGGLLGMLGLGGSKDSDPLGDLLKSTGLVGGKGVAPGSSPANALYVRSADALFGTPGSSSNGSSGIGSLLGGLGGLFSGGAAAAGANAVGALGGDSLGAFIALSGFANGGDPPVGKVSIVGERGPELFVPKQAGTIVANDELASFGGKSNVINIQYVAQPGESRKTAAQNGRAFADQAGMFQRRNG